MRQECPLCDIAEREPDNVFYENDNFVVVRTKTMKGHQERLMVVLRDHKAEIDHREFAEAMAIISMVGKEAFDYTYKAVVMEGKYGSIPDHWHVVITDLEPDADDFYQILGTPWYWVIDINPWAD